ncbi:MAG: YtxH domain-containing protein [Gemmatimonadaceae bacterium]
MSEYDYETDEPFVIIEKESGSVPSFVWGLAIGAGLALLFAPQSGEETRRTIETKARRVGRRAQDAAEDLTDTVLDGYEQARRTVEDKIETARDAIELKKQQASRALEAGRLAAQDAREELERRISESKAAYQTGADTMRSARASAMAEDDFDREEI